MNCNCDNHNHKSRLVSETGNSVRQILKVPWCENVQGIVLVSSCDAFARYFIIIKLACYNCSILLGMYVRHKCISATLQKVAMWPTITQNQVYFGLLVLLCLPTTPFLCHTYLRVVKWYFLVYFIYFIADLVDLKAYIVVIFDVEANELDI